jgi:hypothetical protein
VLSRYWQCVEDLARASYMSRIVFAVGGVVEAAVARDAQPPGAQGAVDAAKRVVAAGVCVTDLLSIPGFGASAAAAGLGVGDTGLGVDRPVRGHWRIEPGMDLRAQSLICTQELSTWGRINTS